MRVALLARKYGARALAPEADGAAHRLFVGKHPVKAVQRALVLRRVMFERAHDARGDGALRRAVRTVEQHHAVGPPLAHEIAERAVDLALNGFLTDQRLAPRLVRLEEREIEQP